MNKNDLPYLRNNQDIVFFPPMHLNLVVYNRNIVASSSDLTGILWKTSENIFRNVRKMFGLVFRQIFENLQKITKNIVFYLIKLHGHLEIQNFSSHVENYFTCSLLSLAHFKEGVILCPIDSLYPSF